MKSSAIPSALALACALALPGCATATAPASVSPATAEALRDPVIGLPFDPARHRFAAAPADLETRCPDLANARYTQQLWVFAEAQDGANRYLMVAGRFVPRRASDAPVDNPLGTLIRLGAGDCALIGPAGELFAMPEAYEDTVPATVRTALAEDAARRFAAAHGGPAGLAAAMKAAGKSASDLPAGLQPAFAPLLAR